MKTPLAPVHAPLRNAQAGKLEVRLGGYLAFGAAVLICLVAAVAVVSHELPLMLGGF